jgi:cytochrome c-type biogenesis protein CcmE
VRNYYVIAGLVIVGFVALGASSFVKTMNPYMDDFKQVRAATQDRVQAMGEVVKGKTAYDSKTHAMVFFMRDRNGDEMKVIYAGVRPGNFDQADNVAAVGRYRDGAFYADQLLVKCPSKYEKKKG